MRIVLLPGLDGTSDLYADLIMALPGEVRVRALCYPVDVCLDEEQLRASIDVWAETETPFLLVAESFSTPTAIRYAARSPENVLGLVLIAGFARSPLSGWRRILAGLFAGLLFRLPLPDSILRAALVGQDAPQSLLDAVRAAVGRVAPSVLAHRLRLVLNCDVRAELAQIAVPVLYVLAKGDRLVGQEALREIRRCLPGVEVVRVPGPHLLAQREPKRMVEILCRFLEQTAETAIK
ncbi:Pimeloyl-ACP methyl ester carboxylesterase [Granulicella rosea]|uniref:Pimeloyl-ACP methyl ester carboxylesterase n=1 Tax=Granulicella rosea TaxID=474952 RepID=A0A239LK65_9BACT|nr:alpha/beta hydrolase [Granulicella rosea]SNT30966.1 Pimeloyl-ACP methyl ester carboxylesterase [Granulicella rosea]